MARLENCSAARGDVEERRFIAALRSPQKIGASAPVEPGPAAYHPRPTNTGYSSGLSTKRGKNVGRTRPWASSEPTLSPVEGAGSVSTLRLGMARLENCSAVRGDVEERRFSAALRSPQKIGASAPVEPGPAAYHPRPTNTDTPPAAPQSVARMSGRIRPWASSEPTLSPVEGIRPSPQFSKVRNRRA